MSRLNLTVLVQAASKQGFSVHLSFDNGRPVFAVICAEYGGDHEFSTYAEAMNWVQARAAKSSTTKGDGLDAANDQPAKTLTKHATDFIVRCTIIASADAGLYVAFAVVLVQAALTVSWGAL